jgi:ATP-dependent helicase HrpA
VLATQEEQQRAMRGAVRRLLLLEGTPSPKAVVGTLDNAARLALGTNPYGTVPALLDDCVLCAVDSVIDDAGGVPWDEPAYAAARDLARRELFDRTTDVVATAARVLAEARGVQQRLQGTSNLALLPALADVRDQVSRLVAPGFISHAGRRRLPDLVRYLRAAARRLDKLAAEHDRDRVRMAQVHRMQEAYDALLTRLPEQRRGDEDVRAIAWLIQELRVSLFAQTLGTPQPVSEQRILRAIDSIGP